MNTLEIIDYLKGFNNFKGVYPRDLLPKDLANNYAVVINTDKAEDPGEHWVSIYKNKEGFPIYFDSFGLPPLHKEIIDFLYKISPIGWYYNTITFQSTYQDTCGMYCVYFLSSMLRYGDFDYFRSIFNAKPDVNDIKAKLVYQIQNL